MKNLVFICLLLLLNSLAAAHTFTWTGLAYNRDWNFSNNWSNSTLNPLLIPDRYDDVIIPEITGGMPYNYPNLDGIWKECASLTIQPGAELMMGYDTESSAELIITGNADIHGLLYMNASLMGLERLTVYGNLTWHSGSHASVNYYCYIYCHSNVQFMAGSDVQIAGGSFHIGSGFHDCFLVNNSPATELFKLTSEMSSSYELVISSASTEDFAIDFQLVNNLGSTLSCNYNGNVTLRGSLLDSNAPGATTGVFFDHGTLVMDGVNQTLDLPNTNSYLNNLVCSSSTQLSMGADLTLKGSFTLESGVFDPQGNDIILGRNWTNSGGSFLQSGTTVTFSGDFTGYIYGEENFHNVILNKSAAQGLIIPTGGELECDSYDWQAGYLTVSGGMFYPQDLVDDAIVGTVTLTAGSIVLVQDTGQYLDLRGDLVINGGEMHLWGGATGEDSYFPYGGPGWFTMTGGLLHRHGYGIRIDDSANSLTSLVSGGTIMVDGSFRSYRTDFEPTGGTIELTGTADCVIYKNTGAFWNLEVSKTVSRSEDLSQESTIFTDRHGNQSTLTRSGMASLSSDLILNGTLLVSSGTFDFSGFELTCAGNVDVYGTLNIDVNAVLYMASAKTLGVRSGGRLEVLGTADGLAKITHSAGYYSFMVYSGATIAANMAVFEYMLSSVYVMSGAHIDPANSFTWCIFRNGITNGSLLTIDNSDEIVITNAIFPTNTWGGLYNVKKTLNVGNVYLINASGGFDGEAYDNDTYNRIHWDSAVTTPDFMVLGASWSPTTPDPYLGDTRTLTVTLFNNSAVAWSGSVWLDLYYDLDTPPVMNQAGQKYTAITSLPALTPVQHTFNVAIYDPDSLGTWNSYLFIDSFNYVTEADETNNVFGPFHITWQPLPIVPVTIDYNWITGEMVLSWTYPISADIFNIYCDTEYPGTFSLLFGSTIYNSFPLPPIMSHRYFQVKAERTEPVRNSDVIIKRRPR